jgi:hypothetical protein
MQPAETSQLRVLHGSPDAPAVNVYLNDGMTPTIDTLDFAASSGFATVNSATYNVDVYGILASGADTTDPVITADLTLDADTRYTVVAVDTLADGDSNGSADITAKVFADTGSLSDSSMVRVQVAHLSDGVPEVYVHVTAPGATLSANTALGSVSYTSGSDLLGPVEVAAGDYQIRVSTDAAGANVAYNSGTVALAAGSDLFIGAIPNASEIGSSPVALAVLSGEGASTLYDVDITSGTSTAVRAIHAVSDVNLVDVGAAADSAAGTQDDVSTFALYTDVDFTAVAPYTEVAATTYDVGINAQDLAGTDSSDVLLDGAVLASGMSYSVMAVGTLSDETEAPTNAAADIPLELVAYADDRRSVATSAKVRIIHASTVAGDVDLYATGTAISDYTGLTPAFEDVAFKASTGYFELDPGTYHFTAALAGTETTGLASGAIALEAGDIITIVARDLDSGSMEAGDPVVKAIVIDENP